MPQGAGQHCNAHTPSPASPLLSPLCLSSFCKWMATAISWKVSDRGSGKGAGVYQYRESRDPANECLGFITQIYSQSIQGTQGYPKTRDNHAEQTSLTLCWCLKRNWPHFRAASLIPDPSFLFPKPLHFSVSRPPGGMSFLHQHVRLPGLCQQRCSPPGRSKDCGMEVGVGNITEEHLLLLRCARQTQNLFHKRFFFSSCMV